ncbi:MAG: hypothetical protein Q7J98_00145, partial [Kiritimatiellia bacterium]|nr:hypothetical protein [Kiritimatiellia bacterium]
MTTQIPKPVPPVHAKLKNLHLVTEIVKSGRANVVIIVPVSGEYDLQARALQDSVKKLSGINLEIVLDSVPRPDPLREHLILFGNRSTNRVIDDLYNRCCTFLDLYYPGRGGYVVRSLHNPFGDGHNIIFIGGSDLKGVKDATDAFVNLLSAAACESGRLAVDRIMELRISKEIACPRDLNEMRTWDDATDDVPPSNRFGWNSLSLRMAAYYMTGDEFHAREFLRLAFPDEQAKQEIAAFDGEMIEDKNHPLAGPYHYGAHWMILLWDLIEESPVFTDNQRLRITNAFAQQLAHRARECGIWECTAPVQHIGSRHAAWNAVSLYLLSRYFRTYYPGPIWEHATAVTSNFFSSLHQHACLGGESDSHAWYNTCLAPILEYLLLSGDRHPVTNGVLAELLRGQDILSTGVDPDWAIVCGAASFFNQAAYLLQDGVYANYTGRKKLKSDVLRLGQSFLPAPGLGPVLPQRLVEKWSIQRMPEPMWRTRNSGLPWEDAFQYASFRSAADATGDYILLDGYMGSGRNAYHNFSLLELRLAGNTVLQGHCNQLLVWRDGMVGPQVAQDAALKWCDVIGKTVTAVGEVNNPGLCAWKRTIIQRIGLFTLVADEIIPSASSRHFNVQIRWESTGDWVPVPDKQILAVKGIKNSISGRKNEFAVIHSDPVRITISEKTIFFESIKDLGTAFATVEWEGCAESGHPKTFVSLIVKTAPIDGHSSINGGIRITENAVIFPYPSPLLLVMGKYDGFSAELLILEADHLFGKGTTQISVGDHSVFVAER